MISLLIILLLINVNCDIVIIHNNNPVINLIKHIMINQSQKNVMINQESSESKPF